MTGLADRVASFFEDAKAGRAAPQDAPTRVASHPPPRQAGDPIRLRALYSMLATTVLAHIAGRAPASEVQTLIDRINRAEPVCAPPGSPWYAGSFGGATDKSEFAGYRILRGRCVRLLSLQGSEWRACAALIEYSQRGMTRK